MTLFKCPLSCLSHKSTPMVATNMPLDTWCYQSSTKSTRFIRKVELCTALCTGEDAWGMPLSTDHYHTLLRVSLVPDHSDPGASAGDTFLVERLLSTCGAYHSVTSHAQPLSTGGALFHPDIYDRICIIARGSSTAFTHDLVVERTLVFGSHILSLAHFARILAFVSRTTKMFSDGGGCKFQSRTFAFTCLAALTPTLPPRRAGQGLASTVSWSGSDAVDDSVFELSAEAFLGQLPWLAPRDSTSVESLQLIKALKDKPTEKARTRLYH